MRCSPEAVPQTTAHFSWVRGQRLTSHQATLSTSVPATVGERWRSPTTEAHGMAVWQHLPGLNVPPQSGVGIGCGRQACLRNCHSMWLRGFLLPSQEVLSAWRRAFSAGTYIWLVLESAAILDSSTVMFLSREKVGQAQSPKPDLHVV